MDYMKLKLEIYESYGNGEMTSAACSHLIDSLDMKYGESIAEEASNAENAFINASIKVFTESAGEEALTEAAKDFGAKIKAAWEKFKAWIKKIIEKILNLGKKPGQQKAEIKVPNKLDKALSDAKKWIANLGGAKTVGAIGVAIGGIVASTAVIIQNRKLKETMGTKTYEYEKFKKEQADLVKEMQDAALKAQERFETLKAMNNRNRDIANGFANDNDMLKIKLDGAERRLAAAQAKAKEDMDRLNKVNDNQKQTIGEQQIKIGDQKDEIEKLKKEVEDLKKQIADSKKKEASSPKKSDDASGENVTDSKILSASTGLVNAVTQTVVALLPAASQTTITSDEIRNSADKNPSKLKNAIRGTGAKVDDKKERLTIAFKNNSDISLLKEAASEAKSGFYFIQNQLMRLINLNPDNKKSPVAIKNELTVTDLKRRMGRVTGATWENGDLYLDDKYYSEITDAFNFDFENSCIEFVQDVNSCNGYIHKIVNRVLDQTKGPLAAYPKYRTYEPETFNEKDLKALSGLHNDLYIAWKRCDGLNSAIRMASMDVREYMSKQKKDN